MTPVHLSGTPDSIQICSFKHLPSGRARQQQHIWQLAFSSHMAILYGIETMGNFVAFDYCTNRLRSVSDSHVICYVTGNWCSPPLLGLRGRYSEIARYNKLFYVCPWMTHAVRVQVGLPSSSGTGPRAEPVLGIPSGSPVIIHPDGAASPALVSSIGCECKVPRLLNLPGIAWKWGCLHAHCAPLLVSHCVLFSFCAPFRQGL